MVKICLGDISEFIEKSKQNTIVCYGAGAHFEYLMSRYESSGLPDLIYGIADSDITSFGKVRKYNGHEYKMFSFEQLCELVGKKPVVILITAHWAFKEIIETMDRQPEFDDIEVYIGSFFSAPIKKYPTFEIPTQNTNIIPKVIHYCWFGNNPIPPEYQRYMDSWKEKNPSYEIRRWDESNYDVYKNKYMRQAYENGKWAFVSDYARVDIIYQNGGIYLDCDVELLKSLDVFLGSKMFCGFEDYSHIALGLGFGAVEGHEYLKQLLEFYENLEFIREDGSINWQACPIYQTQVVQNFGIRADNSFQETESITVYPTEVFAPFSYYGMGEITEKTFSIHHFSASWHSEEKKCKHEKWKKTCKWLYDRYKIQEREGK